MDSTDFPHCCRVVAFFVHIFLCLTFTITIVFIHECKTSPLPLFSFFRLPSIINASYSRDRISFHHIKCTSEALSFLRKKCKINSIPFAFMWFSIFDPTKISWVLYGEYILFLLFEIGLVFVGFCFEHWMWVTNINITTTPEVLKIFINVDTNLNVSDVWMDWSGK